MHTSAKPFAAGAVVSLGGAAPPKIWNKRVPRNSAIKQRANSDFSCPVLVKKRLTCCLQVMTAEVHPVGCCLTSQVGGYEMAKPGTGVSCNPQCRNWTMLAVEGQHVVACWQLSSSQLE